jgi:2-methylcitrate dehydratase
VHGERRRLWQQRAELTMAKDAAPPLAAQLATLVNNVNYDRLPADTVLACKRVLLDTLGCAIGAIDSQPARIMLKLIPQVKDDAPGATVIGTGQRTTAEGAALVNGTLVRYLDFMDVYWSKDICHPSENIPPVMACVEEAGGNGKDLIEAIVAAFEVQIRLADAFSFEEIGLHHVSAAGFVVPLVAGKIWRQSVEQMANGSTLAGASGLTLATLAVGELSMAKAVGYARNSAAAITAARAAGMGFTGPLESYEWLLTRVGKNPAAAALPADDVGRWRIGDVSLKRYPIQYALQAPVEAAAQLHRDLAGRYDEISRIVISVHTRQLARAADPAKFHPANRETADHSLPVCVAMALRDGEVTEDQFDNSRFMHPDITALVGKTSAVGSDDYDRRLPKGRPGAVEVRFADGSVLKSAVEVPFGDASRPFTRDVLEDKFRRLCEHKLLLAQTEQIMALVNDLERLDSIRPLMALMRARTH